MPLEKKHLLFSIFIIISAILSLPLLGDYGFLFPLGRDLIFKLLTEILLIFYLLLISKDKTYFPKINALSLSVFSFWLINGLATIFSRQPEFSFWGNPFRGQGFFSLTHYFIFFLILTSVIKIRLTWKKFLYLITLISFPIMLVAQSEIISLVPRAQSTLNNPNFLAAYILLVFFINLILLFKEKNSKLKIFFIVNLTWQIIALYFTRCRGAYIALVAGILLFCLLYIFLKNRRWFFISLGILMFLAVAALIFFVLWYAKIQRLPVAEMPERFLSINQRLESYKTALSGTRSRPLLGYGPENFVIAFDKYYSGSLEATNYRWFDKVHNIFLETSVTSGILGLLAYLAILFFAFQNLAKKLNLLSLALAATLFAYIIQNQFNIDSVSSLIYFYFLIGLSDFSKNHEII